MKQRRVLTILLMLIVAVGVTGLIVHAQERAEKRVDSFAGRVTDNENEFVGIGINGDDVFIYLCDGDAAEGNVSIAEWFAGKIEDNRIDITAPNGNHVEVDFQEGLALGKITLNDGTVKEFTLDQSAGGRLYRSEFTIDETRYVGGWLVLSDGDVRGAVKNLATGELSPATFRDFFPVETELDSE